MSLIEGVGDEVTVIVTIFLVLCLILLAWFSTHTREIPLVSVIVVELSQRRNRNRNTAEQSQANEEQEADAQQPAVNEVHEGMDDEEGQMGANNNADADNEEDSASAAASRQTLTQLGSAHSNPETQSDSKKSAPPVDSESEAADATKQPLTEEVEAVPAEAAATVIPEFKPDDGSSAEIRRRRVAYFENGKGSEKSGAQDTGSVGAESKEDGEIVREESGTSGRDSASPYPVRSESDSTSVQHLSPLGSSSASVSPSHSEASPASPGTPTQLPTEGSQPPAADPPSESSRGATPASGEESEARGEDSAENVDSGGQQIRVRLKYLNDTQRLVYADPQETVGNFRRLHFSSELEDNKIVRFIFNGQDLRNDLSTLHAYNIADNSVVHCLITQSRQNEPNAGSRADVGDEDMQMGPFLYPVFGLILGLVWYMRFTYKQYFNAMSTVSLAGISFIYVLALFSSLRHRRQPHRHLD